MTNYIKVVGTGLWDSNAGIGVYDVNYKTQVLTNDFKFQIDIRTDTTVTGTLDIISMSDGNPNNLFLSISNGYIGARNKLSVFEYLSNIRVDDGNVHTYVMQRIGTTLTITIDDSPAGSWTIDSGMSFFAYTITNIGPDTEASPFAFYANIKLWNNGTLVLDIPCQHDCSDYSDNPVGTWPCWLYLYDDTWTLTPWSCMSYNPVSNINTYGNPWGGSGIFIAGSYSFDKSGVSFIVNTTEIPQYSRITSATINMRTYHNRWTSGDGLKLRISAEKSLTPVGFSTAADYMAVRGPIVGGATSNLVSNQITWDDQTFPAGENAWYMASSATTTPSLINLIQELVNIGNLSTFRIFIDDHEGRTIGEYSTFFDAREYTLDVTYDSTPQTYTVTYDANGGTGTPPVDSNTYNAGDTVTLLSTSGLSKEGYTLSGWSSHIDGQAGILGDEGDTFEINSNVTMYAKWQSPGTLMSDYMVIANQTGTGWVEIPHSTANLIFVGDITSIAPYSKMGVGMRFAFDAPIVQDTVITSAKISVTPASIGLPIGGSGTKSKIFLGLDRNAPAFVEGQFATQYQPICGTIVGGKTDDYRTPEGLDVSWDDQEMTVGAPVESPELSTLFNYLVSAGDLNSIIVFWQDHEGLSTTNKHYAGPPAVQLILTTEAPPSTYTVTYDGNGNTEGTVPTDTSSPYEPSASVTVLDNTGSLTKTSYEWTCWNTTSAGDGTDYNPSDTFVITGNTTLYAKWELRYMVTYDGNGNTGGTVPTDSTLYEIGDTATVLGNTGSLVKTGYRWLCWNTAADGSGTDYDAAETFIIPSNVTLYAKWMQTFTVTYNGNGSDGGTIPVDGNSPYDIGSTVTVLGNTGSLINSDYMFAGWKINKTGRNYKVGKTFTITSSVILYAVWASSVTRIKKQMGL